MNTLALTTRAYERMEHPHIRPLVEPVRGDVDLSWAIILGYVLLELRYGIKAIGAFVVGIGFIAMGAHHYCPTDIRRPSPWCRPSIATGSIFMCL